VPAYGDDLTHIHDAGFTGLARAAAHCAIELLDGGPPGPVVDLGCGGGVTAELVAAAGHPVIGIDVSERQVELARRRVPAGEFRVGSVVDAELPGECAAILAVGEVVNYAFDERSGIDAVAALGERAAGALAPGGVLLFDSAGPDRLPGGAPQRNFSEGEGWAVLYAAAVAEDARTLVREITTFRRIGEAWRRGHETHRLHLYEPAWIEAALAQAGLEVEVRPGYDDRQRIAGLDVFVARRPFD
jgi:SAM-dependent methyltransferase